MDLMTKLIFPFLVLWLLSGGGKKKNSISRIAPVSEDREPLFVFQQ